MVVVRSYTVASSVTRNIYEIKNGSIFVAVLVFDIAAISKQGMNCRPVHAQGTNLEFAIPPRNWEFVVDLPCCCAFEEQQYAEVFSLMRAHLEEEKMACPMIISRPEQVCRPTTFVWTNSPLFWTGT